MGSSSAKLSTLQTGESGQDNPTQFDEGLSEPRPLLRLGFSLKKALGSGDGKQVKALL